MRGFTSNNKAVLIYCISMIIIIIMFSKKLTNKYTKKFSTSHCRSKKSTETSTTLNHSKSIKTVPYCACYIPKPVGICTTVLIDLLCSALLQLVLTLCFQSTTVPTLVENSKHLLNVYIHKVQYYTIKICTNYVNIISSIIG